MKKLRKRLKVTKEPKGNSALLVIKFNIDRSERTNFLCEVEYLSNAIPGPGNYNPRVLHYSINKNLMDSGNTNQTQRK